MRITNTCTRPSPWLLPIALLPLLGAYGPLAMFGAIEAALLMSLGLIAAAGPPGLARQAIE